MHDVKYTPSKCLSKSMNSLNYQAKQTTITKLSFNFSNQHQADLLSNVQNIIHVIQNNLLLLRIFDTVKFLKYIGIQGPIL